MTYINVHGYELDSGEYVHRSKAEKALGRKLKKSEIVHHIDGNRANNENSNLVVCQDQAYHTLLHARQRIQDLGGDPNKQKYCSYHNCLHDREVFSTNPSMYDGLHNMCREATNQYRKDKGLNVDKFDWKARLNQQYRRVFNKYTRRDICRL